MPTVSFESDSPAKSTQAARLATKNWRANLDAIAETQSELLDSLGELPDGFEWVLARDGSLTGIDADQNWWANCSVPMRAARTMLRKMSVGGTVGCLLNPDHAGHVRAALDRLRRDQAIVAIIPKIDTLRFVLACEDFSNDVRSHRLWFAAGDEWTRTLEKLFESRPGLPTPTHFVRFKTTSDAAVESFVGDAQKIFAAATSQRTEQTRQIVESTSRLSGSNTRTKVCVIAPSQFRLWDDAGATLADTIAAAKKIDVVRFDSDDPGCSSPLGFAMTAGECDAMVTADLGRSDLPGVFSNARAWVSWITRPRVPAFDGHAIHDGIVLADADWKNLAIAAGWPVEKIAVASWPVRSFAKSESHSLAMIVDTRPTTPSEELEQYSSHRLLWELIANELKNDPFASGDDANAYLNTRMKKLDVTEEHFDRRAFLEDLIQPAYAQGVARLLLAGGINLKIFGAGWAEIEEFKSAAMGSIGSRGALEATVESSIGLIHCWPGRKSHPIESWGKPVLRPRGRATLLNDASAIGRQINNSSNANGNLAEIVRRMAIILPT